MLRLRGVIDGAVTARAPSRAQSASAPPAARL